MYWFYSGMSILRVVFVGQELKAKPGDQRPVFLANMALIATKQKANVEKAINSFMEMVSDEVTQ